MLIDGPIAFVRFLTGLGMGQIDVAQCNDSSGGRHILEQIRASFAGADQPHSDSLVGPRLAVGRQNA